MLVALVTGARAALGRDLVGVYLTGSFALGCGDVHADVDVLVATVGGLDAEQELRVRELHRALPDRPEHWAHVLEGSYASVGDLRQRAADRSWLYVDNGQREMAWSAHDDTEVFRWVLHRRAIALTGPPGHALVPDVPTGVLRAEAARLAVRRRDAALADPEYLANGWGQPHEVLTQCRLLYTASLGAVAGKSDAARWCLTVVPPRWHDLLRAAIAARPEPWQRIRRPADPGLAELTRAFVASMTPAVLAAADAAPPPGSAAAAT